jgi:short-subunit dehydrogenase
MKRRRKRPPHALTAAPLIVAAGASLLAARRMGARAGYDLRGRAVLVTGGSRGLGLALASEMARQGARLILCGRDPASLERAAAKLANTGADMVEAVRQRYGQVDVLVTNAGVIEVGPAQAMSLADYEEAMATNFWGMLYPTLALLPEMRARKSGRIVNITSIGGKLGIPHLLPYSASKFAAVGLSQGLRAELAGDGIKVVTVCPGLMRTGSPRNAIFRGQHRSEYAWFSISDALPGLSISAESAARRIVAACRRGDAEVLFPLPARLASIVNAVAPGLTASVLAAVDRLLPDADGAGAGRRRGADSQSWLSPSWVTRLGDRAARKFNQIAPNEGATA